MDAREASRIKRTKNCGRVLNAVHKRFESGDRNPVNQKRAALSDFLNVELHPLTSRANHSEDITGLDLAVVNRAAVSVRCTEL